MPIENKKLKRLHGHRRTGDRDVWQQDERSDIYLNNIEEIKKEFNGKIEELISRLKVLEDENNQVKETLEEVRKTLEKLQRENEYLKKLKSSNKE